MTNPTRRRPVPHDKPTPPGRPALADTPALPDKPEWHEERDPRGGQDPAVWREHLIVVRELLLPAERSAFYRRVNRGEFVVVTRGTYLKTELWDTMDRHARYRTLIKAAALRHEDATFSHHSAAALWRLPWVGDWPQRVHAVESHRGGGRSTPGLLRHTTGTIEMPEFIDGLAVTPLARTVVDVASVADFEQSVAVADAALRRSAHSHPGVPATHLVRDDLLKELARIPATHGAVKARTAVEFANGLADRPGESVSRVSMFRAGLPAPELQARLAGASGRVWTVDFWWPECNVIGEFDGRWKYTDPEFRQGRTAEQVLLDEKHREDDLRAAHHGFARWDWPVALSPARLKSRLRAAGLR